MGAPNLGGGGRQHTMLSNFPKNCMKFKDVGHGGGGVGGGVVRGAARSSDPPMNNIFSHPYSCTSSSLKKWIHRLRA